MFSTKEQIDFIMLKRGRTLVKLVLQFRFLSNSSVFFSRSRGKEFKQGQPAGARRARANRRDLTEK
jgi:hypothetical protein